MKIKKTCLILGCLFSLTTYADDDLISCVPSAVRDAGYSIQINKSDSGEFILTAHAITFAGSKPLGSEATLIDVIEVAAAKKAGVKHPYILLLTQKEDVDKNNIRLSVDLTEINEGSDGNTFNANLEMKLDGKGIPGYAKKMSCTVKKSFLDKLKPGEVAMGELLPNKNTGEVSSQRVL